MRRKPGSYWSRSGKNWTPIPEIADGHLHNAIYKLERSIAERHGSKIPTVDDEATLNELKSEAARRDAAREGPPLEDVPHV